MNIFHEQDFWENIFMLFRIYHQFRPREQGWARTVSSLPSTYAEYVNGRITSITICTGVTIWCPDSLLRSEDLTAVMMKTLSLLVFDAMQKGKDTYISEQLAASIFRAEWRLRCHPKICEPNGLVHTTNRVTQIPKCNLQEENRTDKT